MPSLQPHISIVRCTGTLVTGTSASMPVIRTVTISTSDVLTSMSPIVVPMPGTDLADTATITVTATTTVPPTESISACTTVGIVVTSVAATVTVPPVSLHATEAISDAVPSKGEILATTGVSSAGAIPSSVGITPSSVATEVLSAGIRPDPSTVAILRCARGTSTEALAATAPSMVQTTVAE